MHAKLMHAQRGQAIVETVVFLPMFMLALFGILWTVQIAVQYERTESAVRYAGLISQRVSPYTDYSLYSMYTQLGVTTIPTITCVLPLTAPLSDAAPTYTSSQTATASTPFWTPTNATPACPSAGLVGAPVGVGFNQDVILSQQQPGMTATIAVPGTLTAKLGAFSTAYASQTFFRPVGINVILACYPSLNTQITSSLEWSTDPASATSPAALSNSFTALTPAANSSCTTW